MKFQKAIAAKLASPVPGTNAGSVDDMPSLLTETRNQVPKGWCATEQTKADLNAWWQDRGNGSVRLQTIVGYG